MEYKKHTKMELLKRTNNTNCVIITLFNVIYLALMSKLRR